MQPTSTLVPVPWLNNASSMQSAVNTHAHMHTCILLSTVFVYHVQSALTDSNAASHIHIHCAPTSHYACSRIYHVHDHEAASVTTYIVYSMCTIHAPDPIWYGAVDYISYNSSQTLCSCYLGCAPVLYTSSHVTLSVS